MFREPDPYRGVAHGIAGASEYLDHASMQFVTLDMRLAAIAQEAATVPDGVAARTMALLADLAKVPPIEYPEP